MAPIKQQSLGTPAGKLSLQLCTVKRMSLLCLPLRICHGRNELAQSSNTKRNYCFEVVNPNETYVLQGENPADKER